MSQATRLSKGHAARQPGPINEVPFEIITEVFKLAVLSSEAGRSHGVDALCLVCRDWNRIANETSDLWTKVTLAYSLHASQFSAAQKRLRASEQRAIDVVIDLCHSTSDEFGEGYRRTRDPAQFRAMVAVLQGSKHRWKSISIKSNGWMPIDNDFLFHEARKISGFPLLESISFEGRSGVSGVKDVRYSTHPTLKLPPTFYNGDALIPTLQEVSLSAVRVDWNSAAGCFRNLRKLKIKDPNWRTGPTLEAFAELLAASPGLETLDVTGYCALGYTEHETPLVHLSALKHLIFGWTTVDFACRFFEMLNVPESLETLSLIDVDSGEREMQFTPNEDSTNVFKVLANLEPHPSPTSTLRLKSLSMSWVTSDHNTVIAFLEKVPVVEEIRLTDVSLDVLEAIAALVESQCLWSLKKLYIRWIWNGGRGSPEAHLVTDHLRNHGLQVTVEETAEQEKSQTPITLQTPMALEARLPEKGGE